MPSRNATRFAAALRDALDPVPVRFGKGVAGLHTGVPRIEIQPTSASFDKTQSDGPGWRQALDVVVCAAGTTREENYEATCDLLDRIMRAAAGSGLVDVGTAVWGGEESQGVTDAYGLVTVEMFVNESSGLDIDEGDGDAVVETTEFTGEVV